MEEAGQRSRVRLWIRVCPRGSLWAMEGGFAPRFPKETARPMPIIGIGRGVVQGAAHDDARSTTDRPVPGAPRVAPDRASMASTFTPGGGSRGFRDWEGFDADAIGILPVPPRG